MSAFRPRQATICPTLTLATRLNAYWTICPARALAPASRVPGAQPRVPNAPVAAGRWAEAGSRKSVAGGRAPVSGFPTYHLPHATYYFPVTGGRRREIGSRKQVAGGR